MLSSTQLLNGTSAGVVIRLPRPLSRECPGSGCPQLPVAPVQLLAGPRNWWGHLGEGASRGSSISVVGWWLYTVLPSESKFVGRIG